VRHFGGDRDSPLLRADFLIGRAAYLSKYHGFLAGMQARLGAILGALARFRFGELRYLTSGQKVDGNQQ
jgi:hypothetical protein